MKNALILHGTDAHHAYNWFPWLKAELEKEGWKVWVPDLPQADRPSIDIYNDFLLNSQWQFDQDSIIVGHSSGAVEILGLLSDPRFKNKIHACFLAGVFEGDAGWEEARGMKKDFDFQIIKNKSEKFVFIHEDNDPYCPLESAKNLSGHVNGELIVMPGSGHFSISLDPKWTRFPELLAIIKARV